MTNNDNKEFDQKFEAKRNLKIQDDGTIPVITTSVTMNDHENSNVMCVSTENNIEKGFKIQDIAFWDEEVKEMMESIKDIHKKLQNEVILNEVFNFETTENKIDQHLTEDDFKNYIQEIEKMDCILKTKTAEERQAKLRRIQEEDESRKILDNLSEYSTSKAVKINNEKFLKLLYCVEDSVAEDEKERTSRETIEDNEPKNAKKTIAQQPNSFIEKNIELAKSGQGVLSLTKNEQLRIQSLLEESEKSDLSDSKTSCSIPNVLENKMKDNYALDNDSKLMLIEIDKKLEEFEKFKSVEKSLSKLSLLKANENCNENEDKTICGKSRKNKDKIRLLEINKLLTYFNSVSDEEIDPLPQEDLEFLLQEAKNSLELSNLAEDKSEFPLSENIAKLVLKAKTLMPNFKFRYQE